MNTLLFFSKILGMLLFMPWSAYAGNESIPPTQISTPTDLHNSALPVTIPTSTVLSGGKMSTEKTETVSTKETTSVSPIQQPTELIKPLPQFFKKECLHVWLVCGGLTLACTFLLIATLLLTWKVCQMHHRLKMMGSDTKLWRETNQENQSQVETEAKENTVLIEDLCQTNQEMKNGSATEDAGKVNKDEQSGEKKEEEETRNTEEASATVEISFPSKPQEGAGSSQHTAAAASSEVTEEPKDVP